MLRAAGAQLCRRAARQLQHPGPAAALVQRQGFAASAEDSGEPERIQVPIQVYGTAGRYAGALYMAGARADVLEDLDDDLVQIYNTAVDSDEFYDFLKDPSIPKSQKKPALEGILEKMGCHEITRRFFSLLADNNRLSEFVGISNTFDEIMAAERGEVIATITTAEPLIDEDKEAIRKALTKTVESNETLVIKETVDPSIIGGLILSVGDRLVDLSILTRVKRVQQLLAEGM